VNFVDTMLNLAASGKVELKVVDDQRGRPTFAPDLARALVRLVSAGARGVVHFANAGETTWYGLAKETFARGGYPNVRVVPCATAEFPRPAARPANSVLDTSLYEKLTGQAPRPFTAALDEHLRLRAEAARE
jgi:dTDP-4-dehydrorhamnose reductase